MANTAVIERPAGAHPQPVGRTSVLLELGRRLPWLVRHAGWLGPIAVALFAGVLRFWNLGYPNAFVFDETYYPKDAWSLLHQGYEGSWAENANSAILSTPQQIPLNTQWAFVAHPPLGKWVIAIGEAVFGLHPFGWRVMVALVGTVSVLMLARIGRRLFGSTLLGCTAALLMSVDGLQLVMSRTGLLDGILMFFVLAAFGCLLIDRDHTRAKLLADGVDGDRIRLGLRPWRLAAGLMLGCACSVKWTGAPILAAFALLTVLWDQAGRRRAAPGTPGAACCGTTWCPPSAPWCWSGRWSTSAPGAAGFSAPAATTGTGRTPTPAASCPDRCAAGGSTRPRCGGSTPR